MTVRDRSYSWPEIQGYRYRHYNGTYLYASRSPGNGTCQDEIGRFGFENLFHLDRYTVTGGLIDGVQNPGSATAQYTWYQYPCTLSRLPGTYLPNATPPSSAFRSQAAAIESMHPGEPSVPLPVFLFELKDVPSMMEHAYKRARQLSKAAGSPRASRVYRHLGSPKATAEDWLNYNFGWAPLVSDLMKLSGIGPAIAKRMRQLNRMRDGYIRRQRELGTWTNTTKATHPYNSIGYTPDAECVKTQVERRWVSARFHVSDSVSQALQRDDIWFLLRLELGLDFSITHVWDAMPWTWLVDWFMDIGSVIHAKRNRFGIEFKSGSSMTYRKSHLYGRVIGTVPPTMTASDVDMLQESKNRVPVSFVSPLLRGLNGLSSKQLGTLAALSVTRVR